MRNIKIVTDSSANVWAGNRSDLAVAPLKIISTEREFVDDEQLAVDGMIDYFDRYKGTSKTSCPNPVDWLGAFGDAEVRDILAVEEDLSACGALDAHDELGERRLAAAVRAGDDGEAVVADGERQVVDDSFRLRSVAFHRHVEDDVVQFEHGKPL